MDLKFVASKKPKSIDSSIQRRQRLAQRLDQQIAVLASAKGGGLPRSSWIWIDDKGTYYLQVMYGRRPLEFQKGMSAVECESADHANEVLKTIRAMDCH